MAHPDPVRLARIAAAAPELGLFVHFDAAAIRLAADAVPCTGPLAGWAVGLKDNIAMGGFPCTAGMAARRQTLAVSDAAVTARLAAAGALLLPGLAMDEAALGAVGSNAHFGRCENPRFPGLVPGGSSCGSAALVAAGLAEAALGTDTLGSVRIPAAYCGLVGLKPTRGLIGRSGIVPLAPSLDTVGLLVRRVSDLAPPLQVLVGFDANDPDSRFPPAGWAEDGGLPRKVGIPLAVENVACEAQVLEGLARARAALANAGIGLVPLKMPGWRPEALRRAAFLLMECEAAVALRNELADPEGVSPGLRRLLDYGRKASSGRVVAALEEMRATGAAFDRAMAEVDVLLLPTTPQRAFEWDAPVPANQADFTSLANVAGVPALALPVAVEDGGPPASVQLVGPPWSEHRLISLAAHLATALDEA